jgi:hypothetical protein
MTDPATGQRSFLQALKVPFDLKGVAVGALAYLALVLVGREIHGGWTPHTLVRDLMEGGKFQGPHLGESAIWQTLALHLVVAAIFGVACCRIAAVRIARDEGVDLSAALGFSIGNLGATAGAILFMAATIGFFYACNALAGLLSGIGGVGPILMIVLFPLVLLSTIALFLTSFGTVVGFPLTLASLAVERNGALDAFSRAFSYVFSRPALFFFYGFTVWFLATLLFSCALGMEGMAVWSFTHWFPSGAGSYGDLERAVSEAWRSVIAMDAPSFGGGFAGVGRVEGMAVLGGWVAWLGLMGLHLALMGWVVYYAFGGATAAYFALRQDVDGTEEEEVWIEGEDQERFGEPEKPEPPPPPPLPPGPAPPAGSPHAPPAEPPHAKG